MAHKKGQGSSRNGRDWYTPSPRTGMATPVLRVTDWRRGADMPTSKCEAPPGARAGRGPAPVGARGAARPEVSGILDTPGRPIV